MAKRARPKATRPTRKTRGAVGDARSVAPALRRPTVPPARPAPPPDVPDAQAIALFELGVGALHERQFGAAAEHFRNLMNRFPAERSLMDRSRTYLDLAERELNRRDGAPRTTEERITAATAALNSDQDAEAERLVRAVLADDPQHDLALYLMAALEARRGDHDAAVSFLTRAINLSPEIRAQARYDSDFDPLRRSDAFRQLIETPAQQGPGRRGKRARG